jgi:hypothetical protein
MFATSSDGLRTCVLFVRTFAAFGTPARAHSAAAPGPKPDPNTWTSSVVSGCEYAGDVDVTFGPPTTFAKETAATGATGTTEPSVHDDAIAAAAIDTSNLER